MPKIAKYRFENSNVYEYSKEHKAYIFVCKQNGRTKKQVIKDLESEG